MKFNMKSFFLKMNDKLLFKKLSRKLDKHIPIEARKNDDTFVDLIKGLPIGFRAMAATHGLDVSMAMDDLGWHFYNWHHRGYLEETKQGLRELEAFEIADIFDHACKLVEPHWEAIEKIRENASDFGEWYAESGLESTLDPLNEKLWKLLRQWPDYGIMHYWLEYVRKYPDRIK